MLFWHEQSTISTCLSSSGYSAASTAATPGRLSFDITWQCDCENETFKFVSVRCDLTSTSPSNGKPPCFNGEHLLQQLVLVGEVKNKYLLQQLVYGGKVQDKFLVSQLPLGAWLRMRDMVKEKSFQKIVFNYILHSPEGDRCTCLPYWEEQCL